MGSGLSLPFEILDLASGNRIDPHRIRKLPGFRETSAGPFGDFQPYPRLITPIIEKSPQDCLASLSVFKMSPAGSSEDAGASVQPSRSQAQDDEVMAVITVLGSLNTDMVTVTPRVPSAGETLRAKSFDVGWGGKGANQAVAAARLSRSNPRKDDFEAMFWGGLIQVRMIGAVGEDPFAAPLLRSMEEDGIDVGGVQQLSGVNTGTATIIVEEGSGENRILFTPGANYELTPNDELVPGNYYGDVVIFQLETPVDVVLHHMQKAKEAGAQVILNPAPATELPDSAFSNITHLILNETEIEILAHLPQGAISEAFQDFQQSELNHLAREFINKGISTVVVTLGAQGAFYQTASRVHSGLPGKRLPAWKAKVVDTTAAGDTFVGAFAVCMASAPSQSGLSEEDAVDDAVQFAVRAAARTVEKPGAQKAIPWLDEVPEPQDAESGERLKTNRKKPISTRPRKGGSQRLSCERCYKDKQFCDRRRPCGRCKELRRTDRCVYHSPDKTPTSSISSPTDDMSTLELGDASKSRQHSLGDESATLSSAASPHHQ